VVSGELSNTGAELDANVAEALEVEGLANHGYYEYYRNFASAMIHYFAASRKGLTPEKPTALRVSFGAEEIIVMPDDVLIAPDGVRTLRRIITGHGRKGDEKEVGAAAFLIAATEAFPGAKVELVYLADQQTRAVTLTLGELKTRERKLGQLLGDIRAGIFLGRPSSRTCPNCPAFFICGPLPDGAFQPKFRNQA